jgi:hypothetical protein
MLGEAKRGYAPSNPILSPLLLRRETKGEERRVKERQSLEYTYREF